MVVFQTGYYTEEPGKIDPRPPPTPTKKAAT